MVADDAQDQGRDVAFEMLVGAALKRAGTSVEFEAPADVVASTVQDRFLIECKRPKTTSGFARKLKEASVQFQTHRANGETGTGIVAIDLTRIMNPDLQVEIVNDPACAMHSLHARIRDYLLANERVIGRYRSGFKRDAGVHALLVRCGVVYVTAGGRYAESTTALQIYPQGAQYSDAYWRAIAFCDAYHSAGAARLLA